MEENFLVQVCTLCHIVHALDHTSPICSKTNHDREKELEKELQSMTKCMYNMTKGAHLHKEILFHNARHFGTNGLGSFPKPPENCPKSPELKACFTKEVAPIVNIVKLPGIIQGSVLFLIALFQPCLLTTSHNSMIIISC